MMTLQPNRSISKTKLIVLALLLVIVGSLSITTYSAQEQASMTETWNTDINFNDMPAYDIEGRGLCLSTAPNGADSWGIESFLFSVPPDSFGTNTLDWYRFHNKEQRVYLYGRESQGEWGLVRYIQGDAWGGSQCGNEVLWHQPEPMPVGEIAGINLDYDLDKIALTTSDDSWVLVALNLWIGHPAFIKPLVVDFVLYHDCNIPSCELRNFEDDPAFHYMLPVTDIGEEDIAAVLQDALGAEYRNECDQTSCVGRLPYVSTPPTIQQFEFVIEVHNAEASAFVNELELLQSN